MSLAAQAAQDRGLSRLDAMTTEDNPASVRVLRANGFVDVSGSAPRMLEVGGRVQRAVHLSRKLTAGPP